MAIAANSQILAATATSTNLTIRNNGSTVTTVPSGTAVMLTATVTANGSPLKSGRVNFCDVDEDNCTGNHLLGVEPLTKAGTANLTFIPGIGSHNYTAVFLGTAADAMSVSDTLPLKVTGEFATTTAVSPGGSPGNYTMTATVTGLVNSPSIPAPAGMAAFFDVTRGNLVLGTTPLHSSASGLTFLNPCTTLTGPNPNNFAVGDFNGDGIPDLAVTTYAITGTQYTNNGVTILLGKGDGTFTQAPSSPVAINGLVPYAIATGDFNGDGHTDIVVTSDSPTGGVEVDVLLGKGNGQFTLAPSGSALQGTTADDVAVGDFNGDGIPDVAVSDSYYAFILLGKGDGTFTQPAWSPLTLLPNVYSVTAGDLNGDGISDLVAISSGAPPYGTSSEVAIFLGNRGAAKAALGQAPGSPLTLGSSVSKTAPRVDSYRAAVGDFNGDGIADLVITQGEGLVVLIGKGDGTFEETPGSPISASSYIDAYGATPLVGDFNGDGKADIAVGSGDPDFLLIFLGNGDGTFTQAASLTPSFAYSATADLNGNGISDLIGLNTANDTISVLLAQPTTSATATLTGIPAATTNDKVKAKYSGSKVYEGSTSPTRKW